LGGTIFPQLGRERSGDGRINGRRCPGIIHFGEQVGEVRDVLGEVTLGTELGARHEPKFYEMELPAPEGDCGLILLMAGLPAPGRCARRLMQQDGSPFLALPSSNSRCEWAGRYVVFSHARPPPEMVVLRPATLARDQMDSPRAASAVE